MSQPEHSQVLSLAALSARAAEEDILIVRGAREHNLRGVDLDLPKRSLVVFTGPSGSGKSSMAFDTIFAEGRRRYVESMSIYARQFLGSIDKPDVEMLAGLSPAISIEQQTTVNNPRSTVGTVTEIYDHIRIMWAQLSNPRDTANGAGSMSEEQIVEDIAGLPDGTRFMLLAPLVRNRKGAFKDVFENRAKYWAVVPTLYLSHTTKDIEGAEISTESKPAYICAKPERHYARDKSRRNRRTVSPALTEVHQRERMDKLQSVKSYLLVAGEVYRPVCVACPNHMEVLNGRCFFGSQACYEHLSVTTPTAFVSGMKAYKEFIDGQTPELELEGLK